MENLSIPTFKDWGEIQENELDLRWAFKHFFGKSQSEAEILFADQAHLYCEDLFYMPINVLGFYGGGLVNYLLSEKAKGDSGAASGFLSALEIQSKKCPDAFLAFWLEWQPVLEKLANQQDFYNADWVIYGSFRSRIKALGELGFPAGFDTSHPEEVPSHATIQEMSQFGTRELPFPIAAKVFQNSGYREIDENSSLEDFVRIFGNPDKRGGGIKLNGILIPHWIRYDRSDWGMVCYIEGDEITSVGFV